MNSHARIHMQIYWMYPQVKAAERAIKRKLRPRNAFFPAQGLDLPSCCPREKLHQFLIGWYGLPASLYKYLQVLQAKELYTSPDKPLVTDAIFRGVFGHLRDRLTSFDSSWSMVEVTAAYATHVMDMYVDKHTGKHMTGEPGTARRPGQRHLPSARWLKSGRLPTGEQVGRPGY